MDAFYNKKVLVTGGAGFIGSHLVETLAFQGAHVVVLDNLSSGSLENLKHIIHSIDFIKGDVRQLDACHKATEGVDAIFHLAAFISVPDSFHNPQDCFEINVLGTKNLLDASVASKVRHFVLSSSAAIYGERSGLCKETDPLNPCSPYAKSKEEAETLCKVYSKQYGISSVCLRYFNVYGDRQNPNSDYAAVVAKFTDLIKNKKPLTVFGNGQQTRDFIHVNEVVDANITMAQVPSLIGEPFNVATGNSINLLDLIDKIKGQLKTQPVQINFEPARAGDILHSSADCTKYQRFATKIKAFPIKPGEKFIQELS